MDLVLQEELIGLHVYISNNEISKYTQKKPEKTEYKTIQSIIWVGHINTLHWWIKTCSKKVSNDIKMWITYYLELLALYMLYNSDKMPVLSNS